MYTGCGPYACLLLKVNKTIVHREEDLCYLVVDDQGVTELCLGPGLMIAFTLGMLTLLISPLFGTCASS